ncbi:MAG: NYN domain-containing protein [Actinomycetales bacterium]|nr:NYN domain-containing protein [Actinomycetales bacterium]
MAADPSPRVAVYLDFDNIVISRYEQLHGKGQWHKDNARAALPTAAGGTGDVAKRLTAATLDLGAILEFASSFGTIAVSRAYADWSYPANASYRRQLVDRAVDLTQLFPVSRALKNGADIRLAVDVLEDLFRLPDVTHVVIVAGDSDYIALAQRCKRLGRFVVGLGVAGGTSPALIAACDEYESYDDVLPEAPEAQPEEPERAPEEAPDEDAAPAKISDREATRLLVRALELGHAKNEAEWLHAGGVKSQIRRLNPSFSEKALGYPSFHEFVKSRGNLAETRVEGNDRYLRLRPAGGSGRRSGG